MNVELLISINPATEEHIKTYPALEPEACQKLLSKATQEWEKWRSTSLEERGAFLIRAAQILRDENELLARLVTSEMGKLLSESRVEIERCASVCEFYAKQAAGMLKPQFCVLDGIQCRTVFEPLGAVLSIMPWNFPFWQVFRMTVPALMAGNAVLLKLAPNVCGCSQAIASVFERAGLPRGVFTLLLLPREHIEPVIAHDLVQAVAFTGSDASGAKVAAMAGAHVKKCVMELGGSDPFIVLDDADVAKSIGQAVQSRYQNAGQTCVAAKRFIIHRAVAEEFTEGLLHRIAKLKAGDPLSPETTLAPLARLDLLERVDGQVSTSLAMGATLLAGGKRLGMPGYFYAPTLLTDVTRDMPVMSQEVFGPVGVVCIVDNEEEAVRLANDTPYGLGASLWTSDSKRAERLAGQLRAGTVCINSRTHSDPRLPFGGCKRSGFGREMAHIGIRELCHIKVIQFNSSSC